MIHSFGRQADTLAARLGTVAFDAVFTDIAALRQAFPAAIQCRQRGERTYHFVLWNEPRAAMVWKLATDIAMRDLSSENRRTAFTALADTSIDSNPQNDFMWPEALVREFVALGSAQLFHSHFEALRYHEITGGFWREYELLVVPHELPNVIWAPTRQTRVVVWAPELNATETAFLALSLEELQTETWIVCSEGELPSVRAKYLPADDDSVADLLRNASCIVDASLADPGAAIAFAQRGFPVVASSTTGVEEFISRATFFTAWEPASVCRAVQDAAGRPSSIRKFSAALPPPLQAGIQPTAEATLVSVVCPTYNRPDEVRLQLISLSKQSYPNLQIVLVNDGGPSLRELCDEFPFLRIKLVELESNVGGMNALKAGWRAADGEYVTAIADDDRLFPDHVERLAQALERCGGDVAHGNTVYSYAVLEADGAVYECGYRIPPNVPNDPTWVLINVAITSMSMMARTRFFKQIGLFDDAPEAARSSAEYYMETDLAQVMRSSVYADLLHVDHFTNEYRPRLDGAGISSRLLNGEFARDCLAFVYRTVPLRDRPLIQAEREKMLDVFLHRSPDEIFGIPTFQFTPEEAALRPRREI
ncbi:MAG TPA: glycosyltransferase family 2 protein [Candidatus Baltobacteraceae bacterium]|jgi:hypothetical protein